MFPRLSLKIALLAVALTGGALTLVAPTGAFAAPSPGSQAVPAGLRLALYQALAQRAASPTINNDGCATLQNQALTACFDSAGAHFDGHRPIALRLVAYGRRGALLPVKSVRPDVENDRINYSYGNISEWWRALSVGFEQGFTVAKRPAGSGDLVVTIAANDRATLKQGVVSWGKLRYGGLVVTDAHGEIVPATLHSAGRRVRIVVNDADAVYPLTVDPLVWLEQKVATADGTANEQLGMSVAISGNTALIGSTTTVDGKLSQGAVYVFTKSNGRWVQTQTLTSSDGAQYDNFGWSIALDGTTALIGANCAHYDPVTYECGPGAAYIFTESNGVWSESQILTASDGAPYDSFGQSVALDGTTALVGAISAAVNGNLGQGAAYVFTESGGSWTQTQKLTASDGAANSTFGASVALEGTIALVGAPFTEINGNTGQGAVYEFTRSDGGWTQTQKLTASDGEAYDELGSSIALETTTALIGAPFASSSGAVYAFTRAGGSWVQSQRFMANDAAENDVFGDAIVLDGTTAVVGAPGITFTTDNPGAAYVFTKSNDGWTQAQKLVASDGVAADNYGWSVAFDNGVALIGAYHASVKGHFYQGAAYFYGARDLGLSVSAPETVGQDQQYVSQTIATNNSSVASPAVAVTVAVPAAASFVSATATQGSCSEASGVVTCDFGQIGGNAGTATANVTLKAMGAPGTTIENTAGIAKATPALTAGAATEITSPGSCAAGYTEFSGHLDAGETFTSSPIEVTEAGEKYVDLTAPASFGFFAITDTRYGQHTYVYPHAKHGHRWGAAGTYQVGVQAGPDAGGDYTLCVNLNP